MRIGAARQRRVGRQPGQGRGQHRGGHVGDPDAADGRVALSHRHGEEGDDGVARPSGADGRDHAGDDRGGGRAGRLDHHRDQEQVPERAGPVAPVDPRPRRRPGRQPERAQAGRHGEPRRAGRGEPDQDHVAGHVGREHVPETEEAHGVDEAADDGQGSQGHHQRWRGWTIGLAHVRSTFPATGDGRGSVKVTEPPAGAGDRSPAVRERMPRVPAHQVTTRNLGAAYPFIAEAGLGRRGVVIGDDLLGGSFVFDPFELYAAGVVSNPNMVVFGQIGRGKSAFVKTFLWRQAVFGRRAWVVDPKGEYGDLADAWGVRPVALRPGGAIRLNPLDPGPDADGDGGTRRHGTPEDGVALLAGQRLSRSGTGSPRARRSGRGAGRGDAGHRGSYRARGRRGPADAERRRCRARCAPSNATSSKTGGMSRWSCAGWCTATSAGCSTGRRRPASTCPRRSSSSTSPRSIRRPRWAS